MQAESPDWAREIKERMARGEVEGFFIYSDSDCSREIDFMEKTKKKKKDKKTDPNALPPNLFRKVLTFLRGQVDPTWRQDKSDAG